MVLKRKKKQRTPLPARRRVAADVQQANERERQAKQFRRGRTLAGSTYARLKATESTALKTATPREKVHHLSYVRRKITGALITVAILALLIIGILLQFTADVDITLRPVVATKPADIEKYQADIQSYLNENPLERLRFNLSERSISEFMTHKNPEVQYVQQEGFKSAVTTSFMLQLRKPVVSWQVDSTKYFVDAHGVSFTKTAFEQPSVTVVDNSGVKHTPGTAIASERFLSFVGRAVALAQQNQLAVKRVVIPAGTSRQVSLEVEGLGYPIILSIDRSSGEQVEDSLRAIEYFNRQQKTPKYIDVRVKGKAYYRE